MSAVYEAHIAVSEVERIDDVPSLDLVADLGRDGSVERDAIGKAGHPALGRYFQRTQHAGAVQFIVVAMVEVPRQPLGKLLVIDLHDSRAMGFAAHVDDTRHVLLVGARDRGDRVILERTEHVADRHVHLRRRLDILEDDQAPILKQVVELSADGFVLQRLLR